MALAHTTAAAPPRSTHHARAQTHEQVVAAGARQRAGEGEGRRRVAGAVVQHVDDGHQAALGLQVEHLRGRG